MKKSSIKIKKNLSPKLDKIKTFSEGRDMKEHKLSEELKSIETKLN